jgi:hypothetical protein
MDRQLLELAQELMEQESVDRVVEAALRHVAEGGPNAVEIGRANRERRRDTVTPEP